MADLLFPDRPRVPPLAPAPIVRVVRREPLTAIREALDLSIHDVVNDPVHKRRVLDLYRACRRIEDECWLRWALSEREQAAWVAAHL